MPLFAHFGLSSPHHVLKVARGRHHKSGGTFLTGALPWFFNKLVRHGPTFAKFALPMIETALPVVASAVASHFLWPREESLSNALEAEGVVAADRARATASASDEASGFVDGLMETYPDVFHDWPEKASSVWGRARDVLHSSPNPDAALATLREEVEGLSKLNARRAAGHGRQRPSGGGILSAMHA
jgi:hypothetical protein